MKLIASILLVLYATAPNVVDARRRAVSTSSSSQASFISRRGNQHGVVSPVKNDSSRSSSLTRSDVKEVRGGEGGGTATMSNEMFNMVKAVVGVGVLSLPAGESKLLLTKRRNHHDPSRNGNGKHRAE
jgi:hypothetical protein